jgi:hypothetical protein
MWKRARSAEGSLCHFPFPVSRFRFPVRFFFGYWIGNEQKQSVSPAVHGAPAGESQAPLFTQHGTVVEQVCPANAHVDVPMSVGGAARHVPVVEPGGIEHSPPAQQSAVVVHTPLVGTQLIAPQCRWPMPSGTQGTPLQQSADDAQLPPVGTHAAMP